MTIVDAHAHIFPSKIAEKATTGIGKFYDVDMRYVGSPEHLLDSGRAIGVSKYFVHSVATTPAQVRSINSFIAEQCAAHPEFIGFGTLHPGVEEWLIASIVQEHLQWEQENDLPHDEAAL